MQNAQAAQSPSCCVVARPSATVKPGTYNSPITVRFHDRTRDAVIYYTTDGWTPTSLSTRYAGPVSVDNTTTVKAVAIKAGVWQSPVLEANYVIRGAAPAGISTRFPARADGQALIDEGTILPLEFSAPVNSQRVEVGDRLPIVLAQGVSVGGVTVAEKGSPVLAVVTEVDGNGVMGQPGTLTFQVESLTLKNGSPLRLTATRTIDGKSHKTSAVASSMVIPFAGLFVRGKHAEISAGTRLTARVATGEIEHAAARTIEPRSALE